MKRGEIRRRENTGVAGDERLGLGLWNCPGPALESRRFVVAPIASLSFCEGDAEATELQGLQAARYEVKDC